MNTHETALAVIESPYQAEQGGESFQDLISRIPVTEMARAYKRTVERLKELRDCFAETRRRLTEVFGTDLSYWHTNKVAHAYDEVLADLPRQAWTVLVDRLELRKLMSVKRRGEFERQLEKGDLPEICEETILDLLLGLAGQAKEFASEAVREVFDHLRPHRSDYKTNSAFRVGRRVILTYHIELGYRGKYRPNHHHEKHLVAIDGVFHLLAGKGVLRGGHRGPLAIS